MKTALLAFAMAAIAAGIGAVVADELSQKEEPNNEEESVFREEIPEGLQAKIQRLLEKIRDEEKVTEEMEERIDELVAKLGDLSLHHVEYFEEDPGERVEVKLTVDQVAYRELFGIGVKAVPRLVHYLSVDGTKESARTRRRVIVLVRTVLLGPVNWRQQAPPPDEKYLPVFLRSLRDRDEEVRRYSATALGLFEDSSVVPFLAGMRDDPSRHVRVAVYNALIKLGKESLVPEEYLEHKRQAKWIE